LRTIALLRSWAGVSAEHRTRGASEEVAEADRVEEVELPEELDVPGEGIIPTPKEAITIAAISAVA